MKKLVKGSMLVLFLVFAVVNSAQAANHTVCAAGCNFTTIQGAISSGGTVNGDTITVFAGTYTENVSVTKQLTIKGHSAADTFVKAASPAANVFTIVASNVHLSGFNISGATNSELGGIFVNGTITGVTIQKCTVEHNCVGILFYPSLGGPNGTKIMNNIIRNSIRHTTDTMDEGVGIAVLSDGFTAVPNTLIQKNIIYDNDWWGIMVGRSLFAGAGTPSLAGTQIIGNSLYNNGALDMNTSPPNLGDNNWNGFGFYNCSGPITLTSNKILDTACCFNMYTTGVAAGQITGTGNKVYKNLKPAILTGTSTELALP